MSKIQVTASHMAHDGGTKFYEVVTLTNAQTGDSIVFNRWGKASDFKGGGQIKQLPCPTVGIAQQSHREKIGEKSKRGYREMPADFGFHSLAKGGPAIQVKQAEELVALHYGAAMVQTVREALRLSASELPGYKADRQKPAKAEPEVQIDRGDSWGAWA